MLKEEKYGSSKVTVCGGGWRRYRYNELSKEDIELYIAGDAKKARNIKTAIWEGFDIGRTI